MKTFELVSEDLQKFRDGKLEDLMYQMKGNEKILKNLVYEKIQEEFDTLRLNEKTFIKQLNIYVAKGNENKIEVYLDFDEYNDLYPIYQKADLKIDDVNQIKEIIVNWLLG